MKDENSKKYISDPFLVYSNDGKIYYNGDHYKSFQQLGGR